jgi:hypothetical protein
LTVGVAEHCHLPPTCGKLTPMTHSPAIGNNDHFNALMDKH